MQWTCGRSAKTWRHSPKSSLRVSHIRDHYDSSLIPGRGVNVSDQLISTVRKARHDHRLPPASGISSPVPFAAANMASTSGWPADGWSFGADQSQNLFVNANTTTIEGINGGTSDFTWAEGWDFGLADELFSSVVDPRSGVEVRLSQSPANDRLAFRSGSWVRRTRQHDAARRFSTLQDRRLCH